MIIDFGDDNTIMFFDALQKRSVKYMLIGGWAVNYHGYIRATHDLDVWLAPDNHNKENFGQVLLDIGYTAEEIKDILMQDFTQHFMCKVWLNNNLSVDCLTIVHRDLSFDEANDTKESFLLNGNIEVSVVSYEFLKDMKTRSNRLKDLDDVSKLEEIRKNIK